jgi:hypothetical protein
MVTGSVASIVYGEPRMTHDIDMVLELELQNVDRFVDIFTIDRFYCPPPEVIKLELGRQFGGHFNLIHHETGFKADIYLKGSDPLHVWALTRRVKVDFEGENIWIAPIPYVILRKLEYYREGKSDKHLRDIQGILSTSRKQIDFDVLDQWIKKMKLSDEWRKVST